MPQKVTMTGYSMATNSAIKKDSDSVSLTEIGSETVMVNLMEKDSDSNSLMETEKANLMG